MTLSQLRTLIAIAETGSFTAATDVTGITQSGMSQAIAALEKNLGVKLLIRQRHGVELTAFGEQALHHARAVLGHVEALRQDARAATGEEAGSLRIAAFPSVFATVLPPLLRRFRSRHPGIDVIVLETDDREVEAWLAAGSIDLGVVLDPAPDNDAVPIGQDAWVAVLPAPHRLARQHTLTLKQLAAEPFVLATGGCRLHAGTLAQAAGLSLTDVRMEVRELGECGSARAGGCRRRHRAGIDAARTEKGPEGGRPRPPDRPPFRARSVPGTDAVAGGRAGPRLRTSVIRRTRSMAGGFVPSRKRRPERSVSILRGALNRSSPVKSEEDRP